MFFYSPAAFTTRALADFYDFGEMAMRVGPTYWQAAVEEICGTAAPRIEPVPDFGIDKTFPGQVKISEQTISPFCRVWCFDRAGQDLNAPPFVIHTPNSGTKVQHMREPVHALQPHGNVRLVEQRDPHYVASKHRNGHEESNAAAIAVALRYPNAHHIGFSQSGGPATIATAWMFQNPEYAALAPSSLTVIGSPINPALAPDSMNWMASHSFGDPVFIPVGGGYAGAGRMILPGTVPKLMFEKAPQESRAHMVAQALPAEHIHDTLGRVFRDYLLPRGKYKFSGEIVRTDAIACPVLTFAGDQDRICPAPQTHDLHRMTPRAATHIEKTIKGAGHYQLVSSEVLAREIVPALLRLKAQRAPARELALA